MAAARLPGRTARITLAALLAALAFVAAGCSASSHDASAPSAPFDADSRDGGMGAESGGGVAAPGAPAPDGKEGSTSTPVDERSLIYTSRADQAIAIAEGRNGFVSGDTRSIDADRSVATLVFRVPADRFTPTLDALAKLGTEESRQVEATDVTDLLVDLDARIATQEASVARVRELLARAQTIGEIASLESELTRREADLDSLKQRRAKAAGLVALATITVVLRGPSATVGPNEPDTGFLAGLREGWRGFLASVTVVLTVIGWLLPWAIVIGVPLWLVLWFLRWRRRAQRPPAPHA
jgi:hypothetical protein